MNADSPGNPMGGEERERGNSGIDRHLLRQSAEAVDLAMVGAIIDHADQEEEHRRDGAVVEHLEHGAVDAGGGERRHPEHHVAHVADRRIGDQLLKSVCAIAHSAP